MAPRKRHRNVKEEALNNETPSFDEVPEELRHEWSDGGGEGDAGDSDDEDFGSSSPEPRRRGGERHRASRRRVSERQSGGGGNQPAAQPETSNANGSSADDGNNSNNNSNAAPSASHPNIERYYDVVSGVVKLIICLEAAKTPIRKSLIYSEVITPLCPSIRPHAVFQRILEDVQKQLTEGFGLQLTFPAETRRRLDLVNNPEQIVRLHQQDTFSLINVLPEYYRKLVVKKRANSERVLNGVTLIVIVLLILHGGETTRLRLETQLLPRTGITETVLGESFESLLAKLSKMQYISNRRAAGSEANTEATDNNERVEMVGLGPRARQEFSINALSDVFDSLFDDHFNKSTFAKSLDKFRQMCLYEPHRATVPKPPTLGEEEDENEI